LGVNQLIIGMNKIDATTPPYREKKYLEVKMEISKLLKMVVQSGRYTLHSMSGLMGGHLRQAQRKHEWWKRATLLQALNNLKVPEKPTKLPLRVPVQGRLHHLRRRHCARGPC